MSNEFDKLCRGYVSRGVYFCGTIPYVDALAIPYEMPIDDQAGISVDDQAGMSVDDQAEMPGRF